MHEEDIPAQAAAKGARLREQLAALGSPKVREVRGLGLLNGLELKERVQPYLSALIERGVLALPAGPNVLRLLPPLIISEDDLHTVVERIGEVLA
jgi:acetylornithine/LysW-gamma-L-lysine aminotransferase